MIAVVAQHSAAGALVVPALIAVLVGPGAVWQVLRDRSGDR